MATLALEVLCVGFAASLWIITVCYAIDAWRELIKSETLFDRATCAGFAVVFTTAAVLPFVAAVAWWLQ